MAFALAPSKPTFEHRTDQGAVLGMGVATPRLSWTVPSAEAGWKQTAYEVAITGEDGLEVHHVKSSEQVLVPWPGSPLRSRQRALVRVRVAHGQDWSPWSEEASMEAGLLDTSDWTAAFISPTEVGAEGGRAPIIIGSIRIPGRVARARLYATAHGIYMPTINGRRVDDTVLAPGWTSYEHRLRYHTYDVTELLHAGHNTVEVLLGNGWYRGRLGYTNDRALYGHRLALLAQLEVVTTDGGVHVLATDGTWRARESAIVADDLYDGQATDLRYRQELIELTGVDVVSTEVSTLVAANGPAIRPTGLLPAVSIWTAPSGATLVDFGQNAVGWTRLRVRGLESGAEVVVRHAEVLEDGELGTRPLRTARATDTWILAGPSAEVLEPQLTLHGFRYAEVTGVPNLKLEDIEFVLVGSALRRTGWFTSSSELLNRFHENVVWSTRGNFVDLPTDCPQRDERLGWTGDAQIFAPTATYLYDTSALLDSWLADLAAEQLPDGSVPHVVPDVNHNDLAVTPAAAWGDAATIVPWTLYLRTGDIGILERQFSSMCAWVDRVDNLAGADRVWSGGFQYGDWLDPSAPPQDPYRAKADSDVVATAHFAHSAWIVSQAAALLGRGLEAERYSNLHDQIRAAFNREFVTPAGRVLSDAQTVYALAIAWDLLDRPAQRRYAGRRLADLVRASGFRISTGFVGTPLVCDALTATGHVGVAYRLLFQTRCPSWLYPVTMGATTVWERWDSMLPDGSINPGEMTSFNHYALGAVADWLHRSVAGLTPAAPGYRDIIVRPQPTTELTRAATQHLTPYGEAAVSWERAGGRLRLDVRVPVGATAEVHLPGTQETVLVRHGDHSWNVVDPCAPKGSASTDWSMLTVRDVLDDPLTWPRVVQAAARAGIATGGDRDVAAKLANHLDSSAMLIAAALAPEDRIAGAQALRQEVAAILADRGPADGGSTAA